MEAVSIVHTVQVIVSPRGVNDVRSLQIRMDRRFEYNRNKFGPIR